MVKKIIHDYIQKEVKKGKSLDQIKSRLIRIGYDKNEINDVIKTFETHKTHMNIVNDKIKRHTVIIALFLTILIIINVLLFSYYSNNPEIVVVEKTDSGYVVLDIDQEDMNNIKQEIKKKEIISS